MAYSSKHAFRRHWPVALAFLSIMAVAAYLRLSGLGYTEMTGDQGILYRTALTWVNGGSLPLTANKASAGIMNPPLVEYLIGLPMFVEPTLIAAARFQALLSLLTLALLYFYAARLFNHRVALIATLLFALNPWAVHYSRFVWNPNPVPLFSTLLLGTLLSFLITPQSRPWHLTVAIVALAAASQLHLSSLVLIPLVGLVVLIFWRRFLPRAGDESGRATAWKPLLGAILLGAGLFLLLYVPYLRYQMQVGFADFDAVVAALVGDAVTEEATVPPANLNVASWLLVRELATGDNLHRAFEAWHTAVAGLDWLFVLLRISFVGALLLATARILMARRRSAGERLPPRAVAYTVLLLWILVPVVAYLRHTIYLQNYYFLYLWPAPFLLLGLATDDAWSWITGRVPPHLSAPLGAGLATAVLLLGGGLFYINYAGLALMERGEIRPERTLDQVQEVIDQSQVLLARYPACDLTVVAEEALIERATFGLVQEYVAPRRVRILQAGQGYIVPGDCSLYLRVNGEPLLDTWLAAVGEPLPAKIGTGQDPWRFYHVPAGGKPAHPPLATWENGLQLLAVETPDPVQPPQLSLTYRWYVSQEPPPVLYHFFTHVLDARGELVAQRDAAAIDTRNWHQGDQLVTHFEVAVGTLPPGAYTVLVGLYTWPDITRIPLLDGADTYRVLTFEVR